MNMKRCVVCKKDKIIEDFYKNRTQKDGRDNRCKSCQKKYDTSPVKQEYRKKYEKSENRKLARKRFLQEHPLQIKAKWAVHQMTRTGKLPKAKTLKCVYCGKQASQYHHWLGYQPEHWLDVVPACKLCDIKSHKESLFLTK